jgi:opacity protein-like surface antigen
MFLALAFCVASQSYAGDAPSVGGPPTHREPEALEPIPSTTVTAPIGDIASASPEGVAELGTMEEYSEQSPWFVETLVGRYRSSSGIGPRISDIDYMPIAFRLGCRPCEDGGFFKRRLSVLAEWTVDPVTEGFGSILTGPSVLFRFDACPCRRISPYFQAGTGFVLTDASRDKQQRAIGETFEFLQQLEVGVSWKLTDRLSLQAEYGLHHISNAGLAGRNLGINAIGASVGLHWTFGAK